MHVWKRAIQNVSKSSATFVGTEKCKLSICIVEPRKHENLEPVLWQIGNIYPSNEVALYVFHGTENENFIKDICTFCDKVIFKNLNTSNLTTESYSHLLTSNSFWLNFNSDFVLIIQTDTLLLRKIDDVFYNYDYVGAPWNWKAVKEAPANFQVGNGGFSLRKVSFMLECTLSSPKSHPEDVFFSTLAYRKGTLPNIDVAKTFSVEHIFYDSPIGIHQAYNFMTEHQMKIILKDFKIKDIYGSNYNSVLIILICVAVLICILIIVKNRI